MNNKYLKFPSTSIAQVFKFLPQDFKDCFWADTELMLKKYKKRF